MFGHTLPWWRDAPNGLMIVSLCIAAIAAVTVFVSTYLVLAWEREIKVHDDAQFEAYKLSVTAQVTAAEQRGISAGKAASQAGNTAVTAQATAAQANAKAAEFAAQAAAANLETERLRKQLAWRELSADQVANLTKTLSAQPLTLKVEVVALDPEAIALGTQLLRVFRAAGLMTSSATRRLDPPDLNTDLQIIGRQTEVGIMASALRAAGLSVTTEHADAELNVLISSKPRP